VPASFCQNTAFARQNKGKSNQNRENTQKCEGNRKMKCCKESVGSEHQKLHSRARRALPPAIRGKRKMIRKLLIASAAVAAVAAYTAVTEPVQAGSCAVISAKARGLTEAAATTRSQKKLNNRINHWAHKQGLKVVRVGHGATSCKKGALFVCTSAAKVCP
jgi:hypothetical protein